MRISERVQGFTESVIREMTRVVAQHGGVNLAQGMPNFPPPPALVEAAHRALDGDFHQYAITWGAPSLRRAIADKYRRFYGIAVDPERHVTVCRGSTETMLSTLLAVLNPGDEVIVFEPFYENYGPGCIIAGAVPIWVPLEPPDFAFDPDRLARAVTPRTKAILFADDTAFAMWLVTECGVATVPGSSFYAHPELGRTKIRFCFPKTHDVLTDAGERLQKLHTLAG